MITRDRIALITDGRYLGIASDLVADLPGVDLVITPASKPFDLAFAEALCSVVNGRAGFEAAHLTVKRHHELQDAPGDDGARLRSRGHGRPGRAITNFEGRMGAGGVDRGRRGDFPMPLSV